MPVEYYTGETEVEPRAILGGCGCSFTAIQHARKFQVYLGGDGQLWRYVTTEDRAFDSSLPLGQHTLANGRAVATFLRSFVPPSERRDYWIGIIERKYKE